VSCMLYFCIAAHSGIMELPKSNIFPFLIASITYKTSCKFGSIGSWLKRLITLDPYPGLRIKGRSQPVGTNHTEPGSVLLYSLIVEHGTQNYVKFGSNPTGPTVILVLYNKIIFLMILFALRDWRLDFCPRTAQQDFKPSWCTRISIWEIYGGVAVITTNITWSRG
jgi:hypothetical protein